MNRRIFLQSAATLALATPSAFIGARLAKPKPSSECRSIDLWAVEVNKDGTPIPDGYQMTWSTPEIDFVRDSVGEMFILEHGELNRDIYMKVTRTEELNFIKVTDVQLYKRTPEELK